MKIAVPYKINLGLHILRKRNDGYHDLETVFLAVPDGDELVLEEADSLSMTCSDASLPTDATNLCMKAALALQAVTQTTKGAKIHLEKRVPFGAGLGGGSADAALVLKGLCELWQLETSPETLFHIAASLGSDVPFFLDATPQFGYGRGELLQPLDYAFPFHLVVAMPNAFVSTAEAYRAITPNDQNRANLCKLVLSNDLARWRNELVNDFEAPIMALYPEIMTLKQQILDFGAGYAAMSGSGAAVFGVFEDAEHATNAKRWLSGNAVRVVGEH